MSSKRLSPTAKLLRNSRVFSIPPTLATPGDLSSRFQLRGEQPNSTLDHPIQQAITSPAPSLAKGDWGLKRSLPLRTTRTSTPAVRINALDTYEHITDFQSSTDLTLTLNKIIELAIPLVYERQQRRVSGPEAARSVFEDKFDNTDRAAYQDTERWKFEGPWLPGMAEDEFQEYVNKALRHRRPEFLAFLREHFERSRRSSLRSQNRDAGKDLNSGENELGASEEAFRNYVLELRSNYTLGSEIARLVGQFLDLPNTKLEHLSAIARVQRPAKTHPSAGLSYLRSGERVENHPLFGPQDQPQPVAGRVLRKALQGQKSDDLYGVAGLVTSGAHNIRLSVTPEFDTPVTSDMKTKERNGLTPGYFVKGGNKAWLRPYEMTIDENSKVRLKAEAPSPQAVGVKTGDYELSHRDKFNYFKPRTMDQAQPAPEFSADGMAGVKGMIMDNLRDLRRDKAAEGKSGNV